MLQYLLFIEIMITSLDFEQSGEVIAILDSSGLCLISEVNTNSNRSNFDLDLEEAKIGNYRVRF